MLLDVHFVTIGFQFSIWLIHCLLSSNLFKNVLLIMLYVYFLFICDTFNNIVDDVVLQMKECSSCLEQLWLCAIWLAL
jgi:hypothetical protein